MILSENMKMHGKSVAVCKKSCYMNFTAAAEFPQELERQMRISDEVIRYMVVRK